MTTPFPHQSEELASHGADPIRAIFWEMGVGKTKLAIDTACVLYDAGSIDAVLVVAPNGVHQNWTSDELPKHWPDERPITSFCWSTKRAATKKHKAESRALLGAAFPFLAISYDAVMTDKGRKFVEAFLAKRCVFFVLDESARIKSPNTKRTRAICILGKKATYKRILTGTPVANSPLDVYSQFKFLDEDFWKDRDFASFEPFKTYFGVWEQRVNNVTGQRFQQCVAYRYLDQLKALIDPVSTRLTKDQVLTLPPKLYTKRYFDLSGPQRAAYNSLRDEFIHYLDSGEMITAPLVITRLLRLQQITCGYLPHDDCEHLLSFDENPRLRLLLDILEDTHGQAIIWARFRHDIMEICDALGARAVRYDGETGEDERLEARRWFQDGNAQYFVANPAAAGEGLTLTAAKTTIYFSNSFNLTHRLQSEDRNHRIGQDQSVLYVDLIASETVDDHIVECLQKKVEIAAKVTGDAIRAWL